MSEKFTPGPWKVINRHGVTRVVNESGKPEVADIIGNFEPNAHLIAAAPEMYAALKRVTAWLDSIADDAEKQAKDSRFITLKEACEKDAKNFSATSNDLKKALAKADKDGSV